MPPKRRASHEPAAGRGGAAGPGVRLRPDAAPVRGQHHPARAAVDRFAGRRASAADAAATIIANAVDLPGSSKIQRVPARAVAPDSDLCDRLVTQSVEELSPDEIEFALDRGITVADQLRAERLIESAVLHLQGETRIVSTKQEFAPRPDKVFGSFAHA